MSIDALFERIKAREEEMISFLIDICNIESPTADKVGVDEVGKRICEIAAAMGWRIEYHRETRAGDVISITMNEGAEGAPVVFSGHIDTVHPKGLFGYPPAKREITEEADIIRGPGVCDCKGGVVGALLAMLALSDVGFTFRPVKLLLQTDEEVSSLISEKRTVEYMAECSRGAIAFLNTEPCKGGMLTLTRKGIIRFRFEITGKAVHSSLCFAGASAISEAAHKIIELERLKDKDGITCNCGVINGGTVPNTVAERCTFLADFRYSDDDELFEVLKIARRVADTSYVDGTECALHELSRRVSMPYCEKNALLAEKIADIFARAALPEMQFVASRGGSDAADMTAHGIPTIDSFGVRGAYIHSPKEYAHTASVGESARMLAAIAYLI